MILQKISKQQAELFVKSNHYSKVMPRITKHFLGCFIDDPESLFENNKLVGVITLGWGTRPLHTIKKLFPSLSPKDYYEIGKMCLSDEMPRNSESQLLSLTINWIKKNLPEKKYLFTWADGIVGKPGYVYQSANFLYGGYIWTEVYVTDKNEKIHPRTMQSIDKNKNDGYKYGQRPDFERRKELKLKRIWGKQFRYIYPLSKQSRKNLKNSTVEWSIKYPKDIDLVWQVLNPGETTRYKTSDMPFEQTGYLELQKT
jgi:hypothetical protein